MIKPDNRFVETGRGGHVYFIGRPCHVCGETMTRNDTRIIWELQNGWFRGDDDVYACHETCEHDMPKTIAGANP